MNVQCDVVKTLEGGTGGEVSGLGTDTKAHSGCCDCYRKVLGKPISPCTNGLRKHSPPTLYANQDLISDSAGRFESGKAFTNERALTIESSLKYGCG